MHYNPDGYDIDDWGTLKLINTIEIAGIEWGDSDPRMQVGNLSKRYGGSFPPSVGNQNGLKAYFRYVRSDGKNISLHLVDSPSTKYDAYATKSLMAKIIDAAAQANSEVTVILVNLDSLGFDNSDLDFATSANGNVLVNWTGHSDHFHLKLIYDYSNCNCN